VKFRSFSGKRPHKNVIGDYSHIVDRVSLFLTAGLFCYCLCCPVIQPAVVAIVQWPKPYFYAYRIKLPDNGTITTNLTHWFTCLAEQAQQAVIMSR